MCTLSLTAMRKTMTNSTFSSVRSLPRWARAPNRSHASAESAWWAEISDLKYDLMNMTQSLRHSVPFSISGRDSSYSREHASCGLWILDCGISVCLPLTCRNPHIFDLPAYNTSLYPCDPWTCDLLTCQVSRSEYDRVSLPEHAMEKMANSLAPQRFVPSEELNHKFLMKIVPDHNCKLSRAMKTNMEQQAWATGVNPGVCGASSWA